MIVKSGTGAIVDQNKNSVREKAVFVYSLSAISI